MVQERNPFDVTPGQVESQKNLSSKPLRALTIFAVGFVGLMVGSYISVHVGRFWYPEEPIGDVQAQTIAAVVSSPIAMTLGILPSLGFYGPFHGLVMLLGMAMTIFGTWMHFQSRRFGYVWLVFAGMILWSHNNHLAYNAIMSV